MYIWAGLITYNTPTISDLYGKNFEYLNFNDFASGYMTLFTFMMQNDLIVLSVCLTEYVGLPINYRFFFVLFLIVGNLLSMYLFIGLIVDVAVTNLSEELQKDYSSEEKVERQKKKSEIKQTIQSKFSNALKIMNMNNTNPTRKRRKSIHYVQLH